MILKKFITQEPVILTISPTHKCTSSCKQCCFGCSPNIAHIMDFETIIRHIDESIDSFPSIQIVVLSGGECFLLGKDLEKIIGYISEKGCSSRVVSNGYWAKTPQIARKKLLPLVNAGLTEINFSTGDNHQQYVPFANIVNGILASYELGLQSICINVESSPKAQFKDEDLKRHPLLVPILESGKLMIINGAWMQLKEEDERIEIPFHPMSYKKQKTPCNNLFNSVIINPYSQLLACCGLTVEYNPFLKLGNCATNSLKDLYENQFNDFFIFWLHLEGPAVIYEKLMKKKGRRPKFFPHECAYCIELVKNNDNISLLKELIKENIDTVLFKRIIRNTNLVETLNSDPT